MRTSIMFSYAQWCILRWSIFGMLLPMHACYKRPHDFMHPQMGGLSTTAIPSFLFTWNSPLTFRVWLKLRLERVLLAYSAILTFNNNLLLSKQLLFAHKWFIPVLCVLFIEHEIPQDIRVMPDTQNIWTPHCRNGWRSVAMLFKSVYVELFPNSSQICFVHSSQQCPCVSNCTCDISAHWLCFLVLPWIYYICMVCILSIHRHCITRIHLHGNMPQYLLALWYFSHLLS